ncbi:endoribonuclease Dicer 2-like [Tripterygium wilfordii]|uniref:Endoribonuclease Dicer 2-like n=1 Tax=Tripterygium wilfordii TaxID=458696 RepID=A0A7J7DHL1_TRIWF|nr:endoribonuclease Dicer homolog 2 isoform X2 [Tripterygium wilfordii]KAF5745855.1 endoribonuclease Dicer 2-like [Tripterygium wilfordii]
MEPTTLEIGMSQQPSLDTLSFARSYQIEALEKAIKHNTIVFLETGSGKTLIAIMLLRNYAYLIRKPSPFIAIFLVPQVVLVRQQAAALEMHCDLKVGMYWGDMGVDYWDAAMWNQELSGKEVLVMTPQILLSGLRHSFFKLDMIKVLIMDECHHARGKHPYACILTEFYHPLLRSHNSYLPRIFGMTASPIKSKCEPSEISYWQKINELETIMNSKVYTCHNESVLAEFVPFSTPKFKIYKRMGVPSALSENLMEKLQILEKKHESSLRNLDLRQSTVLSMVKKISKIRSNLAYCLLDLGVWLALKAAESLSCYKSDFFSWGKLDVFGEATLKKFSLEASQTLATYIPPGLNWSIGDNIESSLDAGLLTTKVRCLIECLLEYRELDDIRCIVFVERVIAAVVLQCLLDELLPKYCSWKTKYIAGNNSSMQVQTRRKQHEIVEEFRKGMVNIIVATSILEEGLDVQSCNLVLRFDPSATVSSFIQSRGRARMQNSDYVLMLESEDLSTHSRMKNYLASGDIMRKESLRHAHDPCPSLKSDQFDEEFYRVESTGAIVTLTSSVGLIYFYCSRLPSDGYYKPAPRCEIDKEMETCVLHLPKTCPIRAVTAQGDVKLLKKKACLEACKQLHHVGALTDNLVPDIVVEEAVAQGLGLEPYNDEQHCYFPSDLVNQDPCNSKKKYHCYLIKLKQNFTHDISVHDVMLVMGSELEADVGGINFPLEANRGVLTVTLMYVGVIQLTPEQIVMCRRFQVTLFRVLMDHNLNKLMKMSDFQLGNDLEVDYFLLPSICKGNRSMIDWSTIRSVWFSYANTWKDHLNCPHKGNVHVIRTQSGPVCSCMIENSLVHTPHNGHLYCINGFLKDVNANSIFTLKDGDKITYEQYYKDRCGIELCFNHQSFLNGRHILTVPNYLDRNRKQKEKESRNASVELPPELCHIIMSPISISTFYSFSFVPSIMHRLESLLIAVNLKKMHRDHSSQNISIPTIKILEAITTNSCREKFNLESLETLGDSFLKYVTCQQLFKTYPNHHEGLLSVKKDTIISNVALCKLGCDRKLPGFIRNESFEPKKWMIPGDKSESVTLEEDILSNNIKIFSTGRRSIKSKTVADVVEALIGAYLSTNGEIAALLFMDWIGIKADFINVPCDRPLILNPERMVNVHCLESLLNYSFNDRSLLVEALTHGSYMLPEIPTCYQRLEFLGDSVLDYLITLHLFCKNPGMSPGLLTDMRSASVNNDCYARSAVKFGLHKHILHASPELHKHIIETVSNFEQLSSGLTYGWESETSFPKVLGDVIESLAGAILIDSCYNKEIVFKSIRPLLEPMITPETVRLHPVRELNELCQKEHFEQREPVVNRNNGVASITIEVEANGKIFKHTATASDKKMAKKLACKEVLKSLKESMTQ